MNASESIISVNKPLVTQEPLGGKPPQGSKPSEDLNFRIKSQRAFEIVLWSLPAVAMYRGIDSSQKDLGLKNNGIIAYSAPSTPRMEAITANSTTPYIIAFADLKQEPIVLEIPAAGADGSLYGQVVDAWQLTIADIGPSGLDAGRGGKYLFTSPDFKEDVPSGYLHVASPNYRISFALRSIPSPGKTEMDAYNYAKRLKMYFLSQVENPPEQQFIDPINQTFSTLPFYDERYFKDVYDLFTYEPVAEKDKAMMGLLASLGIERGKPFNPDEQTQRAMRQGAVDAWSYLQQRRDNLPKEKFYWSDRQYISIFQTDQNKQFTFDYTDQIDIDERALEYAWCTYMPKQLSEKPATWYLAALADSTGQLLQAEKTYKVVVPPDMPVTQFWALTVYDRETFAFIYTESNRTTLSSRNLDKMEQNPDGSVTLYVGPQAPGGNESNWIPTGGKRPMPMFRFYGVTAPLVNRTFKLPDFEPVD